MSMPRGRARPVESPVPGVRHWTMHDDRIDFRSDCQAVRGAAGTVLIDPLPLEDEELAAMGPVEAICLTGGWHQRAAWRMREACSAPVLAPRGTAGVEDEPDDHYGPGDLLPGGLRAVHAPGPAETSFALLLDAGGPVVLFCSDLVLQLESLVYRLVPDRYVDDPAALRASVRGFLDLDPEALCPAHGGPAPPGTALAALREALAAAGA
jgi:hypothetical protein